MDELPAAQYLTQAYDKMIELAWTPCLDEEGVRKKSWDKGDERSERVIVTKENTYDVVGAIDSRDLVDTESQNEKAKDEVIEMHDCRWFC